MEKSVLVTGAARGIGCAIAQTLVDAGWRVAILDMAEPAYARTQNLLYIPGDVSRAECVRAAMEQVIASFGRLDGLVNNAGIGIGKPIESLELEEWNQVIGTNLTGVFLGIKHAVPYLRQSKGAVVNIASTRAYQSEAHTEAYSASKGGIVSLTHATAISLGPDIRVNCISPGWIDTREHAVALQSEEDKAQHPCGRVGTPADVAHLAAYLLSEKAGFITGRDFIVDGGMTRKMIYPE